jgi:hypothetical protein
MENKKSQKVAQILMLLQLQGYLVYTVFRISETHYTYIMLQVLSKRINKLWKIGII